MNNNLFYSIIFIAIFSMLFIMSEILYKFLKIKAEYTRKFTHICTGIITIFFPIFIDNHWYILLLCSIFFGILILSLNINIIPSINNINRKSYGSLLYPVSVYICYSFYHYYSNYLFFYIPILTLAFSDAMASLVGQNFPIKKYKIFESTKSYGGSLAFFISALLVGIINLSIFTNHSVIIIITFALIIALISTIVEAISIYGLDNILIPISVVIVLIILL